jgi:hypothetical protein
MYAVKCQVCSPLSLELAAWANDQFRMYLDSLEIRWRCIPHVHIILDISLRLSNRDKLQ